MQSGPLPKTPQKADRSCGRARMATSTADHGFTGYLPGLNYHLCCSDKLYIEIHLYRSLRDAGEALAGKTVSAKCLKKIAI